MYRNMVSFIPYTVAFCSANIMHIMMGTTCGLHILLATFRVGTVLQVQGFNNLNIFIDWTADKFFSVCAFLVTQSDYSGTWTVFSLIYTRLLLKHRCLAQYKCMLITIYVYCIYSTQHTFILC